MASAVLPSLNEPHKAYMKRYSTPVTTTTAATTTNSNHHHPLRNPSFNLSRQIHGGQFGNNAQFREPSPPEAVPSTAGDGEGYGGYVTYNLAEYSKKELKQLKKRLVSELEQVRSLRRWIESVDVENRYDNPVNRGKEMNQKNPKSGMKRVNPFGDMRDPKRVDTMSNEQTESEKLMVGIMKKCGTILTKLRKHKFGWVFNAPVDVESLGLHDYYQVIKHPMDLGTVEVNLKSGVYGSPSDFAADVRLTFNNALRYNPKGDDVHIMADKLLKFFNDLFDPAYRKYEKDRMKTLAKEQSRQFVSNEEPMAVVPRGSGIDSVVARRSGNDSVGSAKKSDGFFNELNPPAYKKFESHRSNVSAKEGPKQMELYEEPMPEAHRGSGTDSLGFVKKSDAVQGNSTVSNQVPSQQTGMKSLMTPRKLPKPKAKDPNKREMTHEEKTRLGLNLQELSEEKMPQLIQILERRNYHIPQSGDEIELDIEAFDTETLWELDRFVTNYKKMVSKIRRQGLINNAVISSELNKSPVSETPEATWKAKKGDAGEEDVDIGEDVPMSNFPPVEIEKDVTGGGGASSGSSSSSSSSSSSGSSSSDSDSGSSSGSDSDADSVQSPFVESKHGNGP